MVFFYLFFIIYNLFILFLCPIILLIFIFHRDLSFRVINRIGLLFKKANNKGLLVHGSSSGESQIAYTLFPYASMYTVFNKDGYNMLKRKNLSNINSFPIDFILFQIISLKLNKVKKVVLIEQEIWPSQIIACKILNIKIYLVNGIVYDKSYKSLKKFKFIYKYLFNSFNNLFVQTEIDKKRLLEIGVDDSRIKITGSIKLRAPFLVDSYKEKKDIMPKVDKKIITFASIHKNEFGLVQSVIENFDNNYSYILVPRFIHETQILTKLFNKFVLFSDIIKSNSDKNPIDLLVENIENGNNIIIDKIGYLVEIYNYTDIAIVGGSFYKYGSQNFIEPIANYCPTIIGRWFYNFKHGYEVLKDKGLYSIDNEDLLYKIKEIDNNFNKYIISAKEGKNILNQYKEKFDNLVKSIEC